jgi:hypothetical protein
MRRAILLLLILIFISCASGDLKIENSFHESVVVTLKNGKTFQGFVKDINSNQLVFVLKNSQKATFIKVENIYKMQRAKEFYDQDGYLISEEMISKEKDASNRIVYSLIGGLGGGLIGGLIGGLSEKSSGENKNLKIGAAVGFAGAAYFGYQIGSNEDLIVAIENIRAKKEVLKETKKIQDNKE